MRSRWRGGSDVALTRKRMVTMSELPPEAPHWQSVKMRQRALVVARNSQNGLWTRYTVSRNRNSLMTYTARLRRHEAWQGFGRLEAAYRPMGSGTRYALWIRFAVASDGRKIAERIAETEEILGPDLSWTGADPDDPSESMADGDGDEDLPD